MAQAPVVLTPQAVATEFLNAATANDWAAVIRLTDSNSLWEYVTTQRKQFRDAPSGNVERMTVERYMQGDSTMPRAVAEWFVKQSERAVYDTTSLLGWTFADVSRPSQLDSLSDAELYVRRLRAKQVGYQMDLALRLSGCTGPSSPTPNPTRQVKGIAVMSETEAIALYEEVAGTINMHDFGRGYEQLELRRTASGWRVVASDEVFAQHSGMAVGTDGKCPTTTPPP